MNLFVHIKIHARRATPLTHMQLTLCVRSLLVVLVLRVQEVVPIIGARQLSACRQTAATALTR